MDAHWAHLGRYATLLTKTGWPTEEQRAALELSIRVIENKS